MYESFYQLNEKPFSVTPDTKYFFSSEKHDEAINSLLYAINERRGFVVITGEIGSGKTTAWHVLLNRLERGAKIALILNTHLTAKQILLAILEEYGIAYKEDWAKIKLLGALNEFLIEQLTLGVNVVLIIDEAQNLTPNVLEEVRMLSNLETEKEKLIQIILMGQPELKDKLAHRDLKQLRQRVQVSYHLYPLSHDEVKGYILHRIKIAGGTNDLFDGQAIEKVYFYSQGVPRLINTLCDRALLTGFIKERKQIGADVIDEAAQEIVGVDRKAPEISPRHLDEIKEQSQGGFSSTTMEF